MEGPFLNEIASHSHTINLLVLDSNTNSNRQARIQIILVTLLFLGGFRAVTSTYGQDETLRGVIDDVEIIAHRGAALLAPENTLAAIDSGIALGADFIEIDIQRTQDGKLVLMHDKSVDRTTNGKGKVRDMKWEELRKLDAGSYFGGQFSEEKIPSLEEALQKTHHSASTLVIEVKNPNLYPGIAKDLVHTLETTCAKEKAMIISFDIDFLAKLHERDASLILGGLYLIPPNGLDLNWLHVVSVYHKSIEIFSTRLAKLREQGIKTWGWTINDSNRASALAQQGINGIVTDDPYLLKR